MATKFIAPLFLLKLTLLVTEISRLTSHTCMLNVQEARCCRISARFCTGYTQKFAKSQCLYYSNGLATFNNTFLQLSGDVHPNPGPMDRTELQPINLNNVTTERSCISTIVQARRTRTCRNLRRRQACAANLIYVQPDLTTMDIPGKSLRNVSLSHLNVRSIKNRANYVQIKELVVGSNWDIFTASETWLNSTVSNAEVKIPGYNLFRLDRYYKRGGGVCAYIRDNLKPTQLKELSFTSESGFQQLWLRVQHEKLKSFLLCVAYRPPDCEIASLDKDLTPSIVDACLYGKEIIITGDLNCDLLSEKPESKALRDLCATFNQSQMISTSLIHFYVCLNRMNLLFRQLKVSAQRAVNDRLSLMSSLHKASAHGAENKINIMSLSKASAQRAENGRANLMLSLRKASAQWADTEHQLSPNLSQTLTHVAHEVSDHVALKLMMTSVFMQGIAQERRQT